MLAGGAAAGEAHLEVTGFVPVQHTGPVDELGTGDQSPQKIKVGSFHIHPDDRRRGKGAGRSLCRCIIADMGNYQPFIQTAVGLNLLTFLLFRVSALNCF